MSVEEILTHIGPRADLPGVCPGGLGPGAPANSPAGFALGIPIPAFWAWVGLALQLGGDPAQANGPAGSRGQASFIWRGAF